MVLRFLRISSSDNTQQMGLARAVHCLATHKCTVMPNGRRVNGQHLQKAANEMVRR